MRIGDLFCSCSVGCAAREAAFPSNWGSQMDKVPASVLSGWKEIASYLGKGVRTVQRYENSQALPVRRPSRKMRAAVIATKADLARWVAAHPNLDGAADQCSVTSPAVDELRRNLEEFGRLRKVNAGWRQGLAESRQALKETLKSIASQVVGSKRAV